MTLLSHGASSKVKRPVWATPSLSARIAILLALLGILLVGLDASQLWQARNVRLRESEVASANLAKSLAQHAYDTFKEADTVLVGLVERAEHDGITGSTLTRSRTLMVRRVAELPQLHGLFIYDAEGAWIANSRPGATAALNNSDRDYFIFHRTHTERGPHIGTPIQSRSTGEWVVTISRRIDGADGKFAGVALATIRMDYFRKFYDSFDIGKRGSVFVATDAGIILLRRPFDVNYFGKDISKLPLFSIYLPRAPFATNTLTSRLDGVTRINSHRRVEGYPLVVSAALSRDDALQDWRADALMHGVAMALLVTGLGITGVRFVRQITGRALAEAALRQSQTDLEHANATLEKLAMQDGLTGLANRRRFDQGLVDEFRRASRMASSLAVIMIDVDQFKQYNDLYGHTNGDECLRRVGARVGAAVNRPGDLSARYGGEEMVILLPGTDLAGALLVAENIRHGVASLEIGHAGADAGIVTVSLGVCALTPVRETDKPGDLVQAADRALYKAKSQGRNRVQAVH